MLGLFRKSTPLPASQLFNDRTFYGAFEKDLVHCQYEAIIESPFLTVRRVSLLQPTLKRLKRRGVKIVVNTRDPREQEGRMADEAVEAVNILQETGIEVLFTGGHHRKLAIFDRRILWEGSLNILSQNESCEIMRRMESEELAQQTINFINLNLFLDKPDRRMV